MKQIIFIITSLLTFSAFTQKTAKELVDDIDKKSPLYYNLEREYMNSNSDMMEKWYEFDSIYLKVSQKHSNYYRSYRSAQGFKEFLAEINSKEISFELPSIDSISKPEAFKLTRPLRLEMISSQQKVKSWNGYYTTGVPKKELVAYLEKEYKTLEYSIYSHAKAIEKIQGFENRMDSLIKIMLDYNNELKTLTNKWKSIFSKKVDLEGKLKDEFKLKGPANFPAAYFDYFPGVFKLSEEEQKRINEIKICNDNSLSQNTKDDLYCIVDEPADFPGGINGARAYLANNIRYPQEAAEMGVEGKCYAKFIVDQNGEINFMEILKGVQDCPECDKEVVRIILAMPNWTPGKVEGKVVNSTFTLPVQFKLN
ncbi:MAG: energy transducer TonB [Fluviicola sp.]